MDAGYFKGTSADQDNRFVDKNKKLMKTMKFAEGIEKKIDISRVDMELIRPWINSSITTYLGYEDDVVGEFTCNQLEQSVDSKQMQVNLTGFLGAKAAREFMQKLWALLLGAMDDICGIPPELKEQKKELIRQKQAEQERLNEMQMNQQKLIQDAIAKIKSGSLTKTENPSAELDKPSVKNSFNRMLKSSSLSPSKAAKVKEDFEEVNNQSDHDEKGAGVKGGQSIRSAHGRRNQPRFCGRNRMSGFSPTQKYRKGSRERSPIHKSSDKKSQSQSKSMRSEDRMHSRHGRRSISPKNQKDSPAHRDLHSSSSHRKSQTRDHRSGHNVPRNDRNPMSRHDRQHRGSMDDRDVTTDRKTQHRVEFSGSREKLQHGNKSQSMSLEESSSDPKTLEKSSILHCRNYRTKTKTDPQSSPENGALSKTAHSRSGKNARNNSASPARITTRGEYLPEVSSRHVPSETSRRNRHPQTEVYDDLNPEYTTRRHSPAATRGPRTAEQTVMPLSPERISHEPQWHDRRRQRLSPDTRFDYGQTVEETARRDSRSYNDKRRHWDEDAQFARHHRSASNSRYHSEYDRHADERQSPGLERCITDDMRLHYERSCEEIYGRDRRHYDRGERDGYVEEFPPRHRSPYGRVVRHDSREKAREFDFYAQEPVYHRTSHAFARTKSEQYRDGHGRNSYDARDAQAETYDPRNTRHEGLGNRRSSNVLVQDYEPERHNWGSQSDQRQKEGFRTQRERWERDEFQEDRHRMHGSNRQTFADYRDDHYDGRGERSHPHQSISFDRSRSPGGANREEIARKENSYSFETSRQNHRDYALSETRTRQSGRGVRDGHELDYELSHRSVKREDDLRLRTRSTSHQRSGSRASWYGSPEVRLKRSASGGEEGRRRGDTDHLDEDVHRRSSQSQSPPPKKKSKIEEEEQQRASGDEERSSKKKKKKKKKDKKKKKRKKHKKQKQKDSQEGDGSDRETLDDGMTSQTPESTSNALEQQERDSEHSS